MMEEINILSDLSLTFQTYEISKNIEKEKKFFLMKQRAKMAANVCE